VALVEGEFPPGPVDVKGWLGADLEGPVRKKQRFFMEGAPGGTPQDGKACRTVLRRIRFRGGISEVEAFPLTGRLHQIRATLLAMGYPVVGDKLYGVDDTLFLRFIKGAVSQEDWNRLRLPRQALHAAEIRVTHPTTGALMVFQSSVPSDMEDFMTG
jgi:23S rRNA-/tRNA-specific pseudouridylate synthase